MIRLRMFALSAMAVAGLVALPQVPAAQGQDASRTVAGGGISVAGWQGKVDAREEKAGQTVQNAKFAKEGDAFHITTGPAITYWNPSNKAAGDYTVKATFKEPKYMDLNDHPHPYGLVIAGNDLGTDTGTYLYCAAYGNGTFIVRGMGPEPFQVNGRRGEPNAAVAKAAAKGDPVTQEIAMSVSADKVSCSVNGTVVGTYDKAAVVGAGKLKSTDGIYGLRIAHNAEAIVTGLAMTKQ